MMASQEQAGLAGATPNAPRHERADERGGGSSPPRGAPPAPPTARHHARRRSRHMYAAVIVGLCVLLVWGISRLGLCWGEYGAAGAILCHSQWATFLAFVAGAVAFWLLVLDLSEPHLALFAGRRMRRSRAAWHGYRQLEGREFFHTTASTLLLLGCILVFLWLVLFSPVRF